MRYIHKAVCFCSACKEDVILFECTVFPNQEYQTVDPIYQGWRLFVFDKKRIYICPKHTIEFTLFIDGKKLEETPK